MKPVTWCAIAICAWSAGASAQKAVSSGDVMGAHLNYGRGCAACHAPHSSAAGIRDRKSRYGSAGDAALWGEDVNGLYSKTIVAAGEAFSEVAPRSRSQELPDVSGMLPCLGCHDGNYASTSMMQSKTYESLPSRYGIHDGAPTLFGAGGFMLGNSLNQHPMGLSAALHCGGVDGWDCSEREGVITMTGTQSRQFVRHYGFFVKPGNFNGTAVVVCSTCHDPHSMNTFSIGPNSKSGMRPGTYATMFFLRGPYNPSSLAMGANTTSQFCRQCHAAESNEAYGSPAGTVL